MIESIEGKRGLPRNRPPYIAEVGIFGRPDAEPERRDALVDPRHPAARAPSGSRSKAAKAIRARGRGPCRGASRSPASMQAPAGVTVRELIDDYCGGMLDGHEFTAYLPGGASGGILPASMGDIPLDFGGELAKIGAFVGSHAVVVFSDHDDVKDAVDQPAEILQARKLRPVHALPRRHG